MLDERKSKERRLPVHRIIPFSNVDGPGNRTAIFVQGCQLNCLYCHNRETIPMKSESTSYMSMEVLTDKVIQQQPFIRGITVSGGEPTLYSDFLTQWFKEIKTLGLSCYIDTNGFFDWERLRPLIQETDQFMFDIKSTDDSIKALCLNETPYTWTKETGIVQGKHQWNNLSNLQKLLELGKIYEVRLVYIKGFYDEVALMHTVGKIMEGYDVPFKLIRVHTKGLSKEYQKIIAPHIPTKKDMERMVQLANDVGIHQINQTN